MVETGVDDRWRRLEAAYGAAWLDRVRGLSPAFQDIAIPAALSRLDGWAEAAWLRMPSNSDSWATHAQADDRQSHAEAANRFEQAILVLRDAGLWPWLLTPRLHEEGPESA
jgi:hypothetical protein